MPESDPNPPPAIMPMAGRADTSPDIADRIFNRLTRPGASALSGGDIISRKIKSFTLDGQSCTPYFFWDAATGEYLDVKVTMRSLTSSEEIEAMAGLTEPGQLPYLLGRASLYALNDTPIPEDRKDFFWEGFGMGGRQLCLMAFQYVGSASGAALGKFQRSISAG